MLRILEEGVEALYFFDAAEMAKLVKVGLEHAKVVREGHNQFTVFELSKEEWEQVARNVTPAYSLVPCEHTSSSTGHARLSSQAFTGDGMPSQKRHEPGAADAPLGDSSAADAVLGDSLPADAVLGDTDADGDALLSYAASVAAYAAFGDAASPMADGPLGDPGHASVALGAGESSRVPMASSGGGASSGDCNKSTGGSGPDDEDPGLGGGNVPGPGGTGPGGQGPGDSAGDGPAGDEEFDVSVLIVFRGLKPGCGVLPHNGSGRTLAESSHNGSGRTLAESSLSELSMSGSLSLRFQKEKSCHWVTMYAVAKGGFECSGKCIGIGSRRGILHDDLELGFRPCDDDPAHVLLVSTSVPQHDVISATSKAQSSTSKTEQSLSGGRGQGRLGFKFGFFRPYAMAERNHQLVESSTSMMLDESTSAVDHHALPNSNFVWLPMHQASVGKLAAVARSSQSKLSEMAGQEWDSLKPPPPEIGEFFHEKFALGWPAEMQVEGEYRFWGEGLHSYMFSMERVVGECGSDGVIVKSRQGYFPTIQVDYSGSWEGMKISSYLLHHLRKTPEKFPVVVAE